MLSYVHGSIRGKLFTVIAIMAVVALTIGVVAWRGLGQMNQEIGNIVDVSSRQALLASDVQTFLMTFASGSYATVAATQPEDIEMFSQICQNAREKVEGLTTELKTLATGQIEQDVEKFEEFFQQYLAVDAQILDASRKGDDAKALDLAMGEGRDLLQQCESKLDGIVQSVVASLDVDQQQASDLYARSRLQIVAFASVGIVVGLIVAWLIVRAIIVSVNAVLGRATEIAAKDLSGQALPIRGKDELARLTGAVNTMSVALRGVVSEVAQSANEVAAAATQIATSAEEMSSGMTEQTDQVNQVSAAIEEMSQSITEVASKSAGAADNADNSGRTAQEGSQIVREAVERMMAIDEAVTASSASVSELGRRGEQIGEIISVINDIADQTNLLALNAAIEAARAGEHGRGFAVVADEVRKLADRTTRATDEIAESITAIQTETAEAVTRMDRGSEEVKAGVSSVQQAGSSLSEIVERAQEVASMVGGIAAAAEEQSAASTQVSQSVQSINAITRQSAEGARQAAEGATTMSQRAERLRGLVDEFKLA